MGAKSHLVSSELATANASSDERPRTSISNSHQPPSTQSSIYSDNYIHSTPSRPLWEQTMAPKHSAAMNPSPSIDLDLPTHWSLAKAATLTLCAKKPPLPRQSSARMGTNGPPGHPGHYGRELGPQEHVPPGHADHLEINNSFFRPSSTHRIEDHPDYPGRYAGEYKPGLRPQPYLTSSQGHERAVPGSQGSQAMHGEAAVQDREPNGCCVIL